MPEATSAPGSEPLPGASRADVRPVRARLTVVGLGPGPSAWLTAAAVEALRQPGARVFARTALHPALAELELLDAVESFDPLYEQMADLASLHAEIARRLEAAALAGGPVVLAVPGDGLLGEELLARLQQTGVDLAIVPGVPLATGALAAAGVVSVQGAQVVEASALGGTGIDLEVELNPRWLAVVVGVFSRSVAGEVKLALQRVYPSDHGVLLVRHPGSADQAVSRLELAELDRGRVELDHLTHLVVPPAPTEVPTGSGHGLRAIVARLRAPGIGCPWDLEQTHRSLIPYLLEEAHEVVDAIEEGSVADLEEELGDVLLQVALHAELADQAGEFDWNDVVRELSAKLIRRHPHVFGTVEVRGASDVVRNWGQLKAAERGPAPPDASVLDGVARSLPTLTRAGELARRASEAGFDWPDRGGTLAKVREELAELVSARSLAERREELGDLLYVLAKLAREDGVDPDDALRAANRKFERRFRMLEAIARERGWQTLSAAPLEELEAAWREAKSRTALPPT
jgi:tetrapyrrole methylase family protein / MazG family protein